MSDQKTQTSDNSKTVAIVAHITFIGWIAALIMNNNNKSELGSFYIRQMLGIFLVGIVGGFIPFVNIVVGIALLVLWIMSIIGAVNGKMKPIPVLGEKFQEWFKSL